MKTKVITLFVFLFSITITAQSADAAIKTALLDYLDGSSYNNPEQISRAFYDDARLFLSKEGQEVFIMTVSEYAGLYEKREKGTFNGRKTKILSIDQSNDIAIAKAEIHITSNNTKYIDLFILKRLSGNWKIISKAATKIPKE